MEELSVNHRQGPLYRDPGTQDGGWGTCHCSYCTWVATDVRVLKSNGLNLELLGPLVGKPAFFLILPLSLLILSFKFLHQYNKVCNRLI